LLNLIKTQSHWIILIIAALAGLYMLMLRLSARRPEAP
jgi:hypothetical protein